MSLNKKILALAIAGLLPGASYAVVSIPSGAMGTGPATYAKEVAITSNLLVPNPGTDLNLVVTFGVGATTSDNARYIRLDYDNDATVDNPLTNFVLTGPVGTTISGITSGPKYAIFQVTTTSNYAPTDTFDVVLTSVSPSGLHIVNNSDVKITYSLYQSPAGAINQTPAERLHLAQPVTWLTFKEGLTVGCTQASDIERINPSDRKHFITGSTDVKTNFFTLTASVLNPLLNPTDGTQIDIDDYLPNGSFFDIKGNNTFFANNNPVLNITSPAGTHAAAFVGTQAVAGVTRWTKDSTTGSGKVVLPQFGIEDQLVDLTVDDSMTESSYDLLVTPNGGIFGASPTPISKTNCATLAFAGSSDRVDLAFAPSNATQLLRVTNPTDVPGTVTFTLWNDDGLASKSFTLQDVLVNNAPVSNDGGLGAQASTPLISIQALYDAAVAKGAANGGPFGLGSKSNKLRVEARGNFGDDFIDGVHTDSTAFQGKPAAVRLKKGIYIQAITNGSYHQTH